MQRDLIEAIVCQSSQSQELSFQHTATHSDLSQSEGGGGEYQESLVQLLTSLKDTSETLGSCQDISSSEVSSALILTKTNKWMSVYMHFLTCVSP